MDGASALAVYRHLYRFCHHRLPFRKIIKSVYGINRFGL